MDDLTTKVLKTLHENLEKDGAREITISVRSGIRVTMDKEIFFHNFPYHYKVTYDDKDALHLSATENGIEYVTCILKNKEA